MELGLFLRTWTFALRAANKSQNTVYIYTTAVQGLLDYLVRQSLPTTAEAVSHHFIRGYLGELLETKSAATAHNRYRGLTTFFRWLVREGELGSNPMEKVDPPMVPEKQVPVLTKDEVGRVLNTSVTGRFNDRRDKALLRLFYDTGLRCSEMADLLISDLDLISTVLMVRNGKGRRARMVPFSPKTALALSHYLGKRESHRYGSHPNLWIGLHGPMTRDGIFHMVQKRGRQAGIEGLHPHRFRHTFAHEWLVKGGQETDLMRLAGWRSRQMLMRYGASAGEVRAIAAYRSIRG